MALSITDVMDARLPEAVEQRTQGIRTFKTRIFEAANGVEPVRRIVWPHARRSWVIESIPVDHMDKLGIDYGDIEAVITMFECAKGSAYPFKYKPWGEYTVTREQGVLVYDDSLNGYPLRKVYDNGVRQATRRLHFIDESEPFMFWVDGVVSTPDVLEGGVVDLPEGVDVEWAGSFLVPVRFEDDMLEDDVVGIDQTLALPSIKIKEVIFP